MTRCVGVLLATSIIAVTGVAPVDAHHSIARFDGSRVVEIPGVVSAFRWINPHASIEIESLAGNGGEQWVVEMQAPTTMMGAGWKRDLLVAGDRITVFANPQREWNSTAGRRGLYVGVILPDGRTLGRVEDLHRKGAE
jgi:Family of unknown function (DUF6152)